MFKKYFISSLILALTITLTSLFSANPSQAAPNIDLPEQAGLYDVPGNSHLKLRVFVHPAKNQNHEKPDNPGKGEGKGKPTPPPPTEVCQATSVADPNSTAVVDGAGWTLPATWTYNLNPSSVPSTVGSINLSTIADNAFAAWLAVPEVNQSVDIARGNDTTITRAKLDNNNIIAWGRAPSSALAVSYIWYNTSTDKAVEIDTIMNKTYTWYWSDPSTWPAEQTCAYLGVYDAQNILTHELGHTVGLDDEYTSAYINNTMYGYGSTGETKKNTLADGDKIGTVNLY